MGTSVTSMNELPRKSNVSLNSTGVSASQSRASLNAEAEGAGEQQLYVLLLSL